MSARPPEQALARPKPRDQQSGLALLCLPPYDCRPSAGQRGQSGPSANVDNWLPKPCRRPSNVDNYERSPFVLWAHQRAEAGKLLEYEGERFRTLTLWPDAFSDQSAVILFHLALMAPSASVLMFPMPARHTQTHLTAKGGVSSESQRISALYFTKRSRADEMISRLWRCAPSASRSAMQCSIFRCSKRPVSARPGKSVTRILIIRARSST